VHRLPVPMPARPSVEAIDGLDAAGLLDFLTYHGALMERARARLTLERTAPTPPAAAAPGSERLLRACDVAARTGYSIDYVYRHAKRWPFTRRIGRNYRFSEAGFEHWLALRRPGG
jgi:predicted DNA-binding transcriptional regulator AlpA